MFPGKVFEIQNMLSEPNDLTASPPFNGSFNWKAFNRAFSVPIIALEGYLCFTLFVFYFGPLDWFVPNPLLLFLFLLINYTAIWAGYRLGVGKAKMVFRSGQYSKPAELQLHPLVRNLLIASIAFNIFSCVIRLMAIRGGIGAVLSTIMSPGEAYREAEELQRLHELGGVSGMDRGFSLPFRITTLFSVLSYLYFPLGLACWEKVGWAIKVAFLGSVVTTVIYSVGIGAQSGMGYLLFAALPVALYKSYVSARSFTQVENVGRKRSWLKVGRAKIIVGALVVFLVATVVFFQVDRAESRGEVDLDVAARLGQATFCAPADVTFLPITGGKYNFGLVMLSMYITHGYTGLAFSMEIPFEWTYGLGWSRGLNSMARDYLGTEDVFSLTYLSRNEDHSGWPALRWWSTIFPWLASDVTFFGTAFVMAGVGFIIGKCWSNLLLTGNPVSFGILAQFFTLVFMIPANNFIFQTIENLFTVVGMTIIYLFSQKLPGPKIEN